MLGCWKNITLPRSTIDEAVQVDAHHRKVAPATSCGVAGSNGAGGIGLEDVSTDIPHWQAADESAIDQPIPATDLFNEPEREDYHTEGLRNAVEAGCKEFGRSAGNAKGLEDARRVVGDDLVWSVVSSQQATQTYIHTCHVLTAHEEETDPDAIAGALLEKTLAHLLWCEMTSIQALGLFADLAELLANIRMISW